MHGARAVEVTSVGQALDAIEFGQQRRCCCLLVVKEIVLGVVQETTKESIQHI